MIFCEFCNAKLVWTPCINARIPPFSRACIFCGERYATWPTWLTFYTFCSCTRIEGISRKLHKFASLLASLIQLPFLISLQCFRNFQSNFPLTLSFSLFFFPFCVLIEFWTHLHFLISIFAPKIPLANLNKMLNFSAKTQCLKICNPKCCIWDFQFWHFSPIFVL